MDIAYHFGTIYVLSRWAGFGPHSAKLIATCSQFVDDNIDNVDGDKASSRGKGYDVRADGRIIRYSGHELWDNIWSRDGNEEIWIPFHFLPGLEGETEEDKLICRKNGVLARELKEKLCEIDYTKDPNYTFKLGIGLHVFADTWAHQGFSGVPSIKNMVKELAVQFFDQDNWSSLEQIADMVKNMTMNVAAPLGHAAAIHWPDRPYAKWKSSKFPNGRDNCEEFLEASRECYNVLAIVSNDHPLELDSIQEKLLRLAFTDMREEDSEKRNAIWLDWIKNNAFGFDDHAAGDMDLSYSPSFILADANYHQQFYESIDQYYRWCQRRLEENGVTCVGYAQDGSKLF